VLTSVPAPSVTPRQDDMTPVSVPPGDASRLQASA
jgi:hypothetical protein